MKKIPKHVAIILDGNRRWAKEKGLTSYQGHYKGFENIRELVPAIIERGVKYLSVFAFSTENFKRSEEEVNYLMDLFVEVFNKDYLELGKQDIKIIFSGRKDNLRDDVIKAMNNITKITQNNTKGVFNICLNYGGQQEITDATRQIASKVKQGTLKIEDINEQTVFQNLYNDLPPIDLLIRTSGEYRLSNFMLYQLSYAELFFIKIYFPDFTIDEFDKIIDEYQKRNRRFGG